MISATPYARLPDPEFQAEFYRDVPAKRLFAWAVDTFAVAVMTAVIVPLTAFIALFFLPVLFLTVNFLYRWATLTSGSATWGMRLAAIEFRRIDGSRFDGVTAFLHTLGYTLSISSVLPQMASMVLMATGPRAQGLSDLVLGTVAINRAAQR